MFSHPIKSVRKFDILLYSVCWKNSLSDNITFFIYYYLSSLLNCIHRIYCWTIMRAAIIFTVNFWICIASISHLLTLHVGCQILAGLVLLWSWWVWLVTNQCGCFYIYFIFCKFRKNLVKTMRIPAVDLKMLFSHLL